MALPQPRILFGIHMFTAYNRLSGLYYGALRVLGNSSLALTGELIQLNGGSNRYPWDIQDGTISAELSLSVKEYPDFLFELFLGKAPTPIVASPTGSVSAALNKLGTSLINAVTGIDAISALSGSEGNLKFGKYVVRAASATTVDIFASTDVDFQRGTDVDFQNGLLKVNATPLTVTSGADTNITDLGLKLEGGSGTIALTIGDTATFEVLPPHQGAMEVNIGANSDVFPEFGAIMIAERKSDGSMFDIEAYRVKALGLPIGLQEKAFSEAEITAQCFYDSAKNSVMRMRHVYSNQ